MTSNYDINKRRPDMYFDKELYPDVLWSTHPHKCKHCDNTFINSEGVCFPHSKAPAYKNPPADVMKNSSKADWHK